MPKRYQDIPVPPYPGTREKGKESLINVAAVHWSELNNPVTDRRTDLYDKLLGYDPETPTAKKR